MSRRPRSPLRRASRYRLQILRLSVTVARDWAATLGTPRQTLPPSAYEAIGDEALVLDSIAPALFYEARSRAEDRALRRMSAEQEDAAIARHADLLEQLYYPDRVIARATAAALSAARAEVEELAARVAELERARA